MKSLVRKLVAGPKKKTPYNGQELDLTYITDRVIAMAFPASNFFQKTYRNSIDDVANYLNEYHKDNFLIINVSSRPYDYSKFNNRVVEYDWPDHQAPPLTTLFDLAHRAYIFLKNNTEGVVAVHCNHGKGRTGTAIISILLYLGIYKNAQEALIFYNSRRFSTETYGVDQPCQTRYLGFVQDILLLNKIPDKLIAYRLSNVSCTGLHEKHYVSIKQVRTGKTLVQKFNFLFHSDLDGSPLIGDLFIQVFEDAWPASKQIARINYHSYFLNTEPELSVKTLKKDVISVVFRGHSIKCSKSVQTKNFTITLSFEYFCLCHLQGSEWYECQCMPIRQPEEKYWQTMIEHKKETYNVSKQERANFFSTPFVNVEKQLQKQKQQKEQFEVAYSLGVHMSNLNESAQIIGQFKKNQTLGQQQLGVQREAEKQFIGQAQMQKKELIHKKQEQMRQKPRKCSQDIFKQSK